MKPSSRRKQPSGFTITFPEGVRRAGVVRLWTSVPVTFDRDGRATGGEVVLETRGGGEISFRLGRPAS